MAGQYNSKPKNKLKRKDTMTYAEILKAEQKKGRYLDVKLSDYKSTKNKKLSIYDTGRYSNHFKSKK